MDVIDKPDGLLSMEPGKLNLLMKTTKANTNSEKNPQGYVLVCLIAYEHKWYVIDHRIAQRILRTHLHLGFFYFFWGRNIIKLNDYKHKK